jgi:hypothetical protein
MAVRWLAGTTDDRGAAARVGRDGDDLVAEWIGIGRLVVGRDGSDPRFSAVDGAEAAGVEKIRRGIVALLLRHLRGELGIHGAAFTVDGRVAVVVGASGRGKSTLAAYACTQRSASLVADDAVAIERDGEVWRAVPLERDHWLDADARRAVGFRADTGVGFKAPSPAVAVASGPLAIGVIAVLEWADVERPRCARLTGLPAIAALLPLLVRFVIDEPDVQRQELDLVADLVARVPVVRLERPRSLDALSATVDAIAAVLQEGNT